VHGSKLAALVVLAGAFGVVEAAIVVELRSWLDPGGTLFPRVVVPSEILRAEAGREIATLCVLAAAGWLAGTTWVARFAAFLIAFGCWDLVYYAALWGWMDWPTSLGTWDLLFLVPVPWYGPVYAPMSVAAIMIGAGGIASRHERMARFRVRPGHILAALVGGTMIFASFVLPARGGVQPPGRYPVEWWAAGLAVGITAFLHAWRWNRRAVEFSSAGAPTSIAPDARARRPRAAR
jgi:hypothetical protein